MVLGFVRIALTLGLATSVHGCAAATGSGPEAATSAGASRSASPALPPAASIRLAGAAASGAAEAGGWLWVTHYDASVLSQVDPRTDAEIGTVEVGPGAASVTAIGGDVWIAHYSNRPGDARLSRVAPLTAAVTGSVPLPHLCCELAGAAGRVWALDPRGTLMAIDAASGVIASRTAVAVDPAVHAGVMADERGVWLSSDTTPLLRIDPATGSVVATIDVGGGIPMAIAHGLVWGAGPHHVWAVDPASNTVRARLALDDTIEVLSLAVTDDTLWVGARRPGYIGVVRRFDLASQRLTGETAVGLPARVLVALGHVWVVDWDTNRLLRFD